jgi:hypothetical protein
MIWIASVRISCSHHQHTPRLQLNLLIIVQSVQCRIPSSQFLLKAFNIQNQFTVLPLKAEDIQHNNSFEPRAIVELYFEVASPQPLLAVQEALPVPSILAYVTCTDPFVWRLFH